MSTTERKCADCRQSRGDSCASPVICLGRDQWQPSADALAARQEPAGGANGEQPAPTPNGNPAAWSLVMQDMVSRDLLGLKRYGTRLQPHNGRDSLRDAYEEALDLAVYLRNAIFERDGK